MARPRKVLAEPAAEAPAVLPVEAPNARVDNSRVQVWQEYKGRNTLIREYSAELQPGSTQAQRKEWAESFAGKNAGRTVQFVVLK